MNVCLPCNYHFSMLGFCGYIELGKFFLCFLSVMRWLWFLILRLPFGDITWVSVNLLSLLIFIDYVEIWVWISNWGSYA